jgi:ligand-binding sensor domain-containing protein
MKLLIKIYNITLLLIILLTATHHAEKESIEIYLQGKKITDIKNDGVDIWVTTEGDGIYKYVKWKNEWINYSSANNKIKQDFFYCIEVGPRYIWAGSADGLYTYDKKRNRWNRRRFAMGGQFGNWIRSLKFDKKENKLWIGRFKYLTQFDLISKKYTDFDLTKDKNDKTNSIKAIDLDGDSLIWIGVEAGIHKYVKSDSSFSTTFYDSKTNFFLNEGDQVSVTDMLFEQNNIWLATDEFRTPENPDFNLGGLFKYDRGIKWIRFDEFNKLNGSGIYSIELTGNFIWTAVYSFNPENKMMNGKGLSLINRKTLETKKIENDLVPETIYSLHYDGENMWLGTNDGIRKISLTNLLVPDLG